MTHPKSDKRELLKTSAILVLGTASVDVWIKPVVDSVILPAHALTSIDALQRLVGTWRGQYYSGENTALIANGFFGSEFFISITIAGGSISGQVNGAGFEFVDSIVEATTSGISLVGPINLSGNYNSTFNEIVGVLRYGVASSESFIAVKI